MSTYLCILVHCIDAVLNLKVRVFKISPIDVHRFLLTDFWFLTPSLFKYIIIHNSMTQHLRLLFSSTFVVLHMYMYMYMCIKCNYSGWRCPSWPLYSGQLGNMAASTNHCPPLCIFNDLILILWQCICFLDIITHWSNIFMSTMFFFLLNKRNLKMVDCTL